MSPEKQTSKNRTPQIRNDMYYLDSVTFLVEGQLFKVPRYSFVKDSSVFRTAFNLPPGDLKAEGSSDGNPFRLDGVKSRDFQRLLKVIYPLDTGSHLVLPWEEWLSALRLATMYDFSRIRQLAIEEMPKCKADPVQVILAASEFSLDDWILPAYYQLARRPQSLSASDAQLLGWDTAVGIAHVRGDLLPPPSAWSLPPGWLEKVIKDTFPLPWNFGSWVGMPETVPIEDEDLRKLLLAKEHKLKDWALQSYRKMARCKPLSVEHAKRLGLETAVQIYQVREAFSKGSTFHPTTDDDTTKTRETLAPIIQDIFAQELEGGVGEWGVVERICVAKERKVKSWLMQGYAELTERKHPICFDEASQLGLETAVGICQARERARETVSALQAPMTFEQHAAFMNPMAVINAKDETAEAAIHRIMGPELDQMPAFKDFPLVQRIIIAKSNNIGSWMIEAYSEMVTRARPPTVEECKKLACWDTSMKIFQVRDKIASYVCERDKRRRLDHNFDAVIERVLRSPSL
ncbi:hypothetical protein JAAARDRAFT_37607 [Jaapia argillacea MUCL 33604]|uniref:BTB domain-containing protein n=1 Tax=Jaapia argillacea MUCL 33604 TaxID=933084 RepID=A0A067PJW1_9AGAM|nr:hypothetical protein JAAARDRAFT_37607 [Jaapia argillacea MUCL 33604]